MVITGYQLNNGNLVTFSNNNVITTNHALNEQNTVNTYRIFVKWIDGTGETMNNADDTSASSNGVASVDITINFIQTTSSN